jgi:hypothetical protein
MRLATVVRNIVRHPVNQLIRRWHWKNAVLSAALRSALFFVATIPNGPAAALRAALTESALCVPMVGVLGALIQAFHDAKPIWASTLIVTVVMPSISQVVELGVHRATRTPSLNASEPLSMALSVLSSALTLFVMRRGALLVGEDGAGIHEDVARLPQLVLEFALTPFGRCAKRCE